MFWEEEKGKRVLYKLTPNHSDGVTCNVRRRLGENFQNWPLKFGVVGICVYYPFLEEGIIYPSFMVKDAVTLETCEGSLSGESVLDGW